MSKKIEKTEFEKMLEQKIAEEEAQENQRESMETEANADLPENMEGTSVELDEMRQALAAQTEECEQLKDQVLRVRAEFDNYRKRMLREMDQVRQSASSNLIKNLLPALDNLERALAHASEDDGLAEGVRMVHKQFQEVLSNEGLEPIPARGELFDPNVHDALAAVPSEDIAQGTVVEEYERGYKLRDVVLRPARVVVSSGPEMSEGDQSADTEEVSTGDDALPSE